VSSGRLGKEIGVRRCNLNSFRPRAGQCTCKLRGKKVALSCDRGSEPYFGLLTEEMGATLRGFFLPGARCDRSKAFEWVL